MWEDLDGFSLSSLRVLKSREHCALTDEKLSEDVRGNEKSLKRGLIISLLVFLLLTPTDWLQEAPKRDDSVERRDFSSTVYTAFRF